MKGTRLALEELLAEHPEAAALRFASPPPRPEDAIVLYGAGVVGRAVLVRLRQAGIEPAAFADDTPAKQGGWLDGVPILSAQQAAATFGARLVLVVTIVNPLLRFLDARARLSAIAPKARVLSYAHLARVYPDALLPYSQFDRLDSVLAAAPAIRRAFDLWADEESRRQFVAHLRFRLHLDFEALPANGGEGYFPGDLVPQLPGDTVFVDGGAYDGDTIRSFLARQCGRFGRIHAFEPDPVNCGRLRAFVDGLEPETSARVHVHNAAVSAQSGSVRFNATGDMSAAVASDGVDVPAVRIQDVVAVDREPVYLKLDVEGFEREALEGAAALVRSARPFLAVSVYHRPSDLWELPAFIGALNPGYRLSLRTEGEDGMDAICFAVPCP